MEKICAWETDRVDQTRVLVVGAGTAGLTVALELAKVGIEALVVSSGRLRSFRHESQYLEEGGYYDDTNRLSHWEIDGDNGEIPGINGLVGGRSLCWHGVVLPVPEAVLQMQWPTETRTSLLDRARSKGLYSAVLDDLASWKGSPVSLPVDEVGRRISKMIGVQLTSVPQVSTSLLSEGRRVWNVYSPLEAWIGSRIARYQNIELPQVRYGLTAVHLSVSEGRVSGCSFLTESGELVQIQSERVVLAAGTMESTRLYAQAEPKPVSHSKSVMTGLRDHVIHGVVVTAPSSIRNLHSPGERTFLMAPVPELEANLFFELHSDGLDEPICDVWWIAEQHPNESQRIEVMDGPAPSACVIHWADSQIDRGFIGRRNDYLNEILQALGLGPSGPGPDLTNRDYESAVGMAVSTGKPMYYKQPLGSTNHESGTLPLGEELDPVCRSRSIEGLSVVAGASFPRTGAANPTLTLLGLARLAAEAVGAELLGSS